MKFVLRRQFLVAGLGFVASFAAIGPLVAQTKTAPPRVAIILSGTMVTEQLTVETYREALRKLGYVEGRNLILDFREAGGRLERLPKLVEDLLRADPKVIVVSGSQAMKAAKAATSTIPIVAQTIGEPVEQGYAASLARPGGNVTGNALIQEVSDEKTVEIVSTLLPRASRVALLTNSSNPISDGVKKRFQSSASKLGLSAVFLDTPNADELPKVLGRLPSLRADALIVSNDALFFSNRAAIFEHVARTRMPAIYGSDGYMADGGLLSYSYSRVQMIRNAARFVDRILKGAKPGDLPFEQPTIFELVINLKTAKALGLKIPQSLLLRADRVID